MKPRKAQLEELVRYVATIPKEGELSDGKLQKWTERHVYEKLIEVVGRARSFYPDEAPPQATAHGTSRAGNDAGLKTYFLEIENELPASEGATFPSAADRATFVIKNLHLTGDCTEENVLVRETGGHVAIDTTMKWCDLERLLKNAGIAISDLWRATPGEIAIATMADELGQLSYN